MPSIAAPSEWVSKLAASAWWNGSASLPRVWSRRWREATWLRALCGSVTSAPSLPRSYADALTSSAVGSPVRTSAPPARRLGSTAASGASCSTTSSPSLTEWDRATSSWRTSQRSLFGGLTQFSEPWPKAGGMRSGCVWRRPTWERRTDAIGGSAWHTPDTGPGASTRGATAKPYGLQTDAENWPTARVTDTHGPGFHGQGGQDLRTEATNWPTADAAVMNDATYPEAWAEFCRRSKLEHGNGNGHGTTLAMAAKLWPTATVETGAQTTENPSPGQTGGTSLEGAARAFPSLPDLLPSLPGIASYLAICHGHRRFLNPRFVESLMGFATDWTRPCGIGDTVSVGLETPSCPSREPQPLPSYGDGSTGDTGEP